MTNYSPPTSDLSSGDNCRSFLLASYPNRGSVSFRDVSWSLPKNGQTILKQMSFVLSPKKVLGIVGPNGAGKSTLLRLLYRYYTPSTGTVEIDGIDIWKMKSTVAAQKVAAVLQEQPVDFALTVSEIVGLGRTPHRIGFVGSDSTRDKLIIESLLKTMSLEGIASRSLGSLSGGERQRVMIARALAQEPSILVLDEPTNHLDIRHQLEVLKLISNLPLTIVTSLHDLNMAAGICDEVILLKEGHVMASGKPTEVFSASAISTAFGVDAMHEILTPSNKTHFTFNLKHKERNK